MSYCKVPTILAPTLTTSVWRQPCPLDMKCFLCRTEVSVGVQQTLDLLIQSMEGREIAGATEKGDPGLTKSTRY